MTEPPSRAPRGDGRDALIEAYKKDVDRSLLLANLRLTAEERIVRLMELARFADELRRAGREVRTRR
jgi:hypothetical protein